MAWFESSIAPHAHLAWLQGLPVVEVEGAAWCADALDGVPVTVTAAGEIDDPEPLGDIAIAYDTCAAEAAAAGKPMRDHVQHLVVHGFLHLLGYDHIDDADATVMEATEVRILARLGLSDPY